jgi:hypothetical protein
LLAVWLQKSCLKSAALGAMDNLTLKYIQLRQPIRIDLFRLDYE